MQQFNKTPQIQNTNLNFQLKPSTFPPENPENPSNMNSKTCNGHKNPKTYTYKHLEHIHIA